MGRKAKGLNAVKTAYGSGVTVVRVILVVCYFLISPAKIIKSFPGGIGYHGGSK